MHTGSFKRGFRFLCLRWYKLFIDEWRQYISQVFIFAFLIQFTKFAKIKTSRKFLLIQYLIVKINTHGKPYGAQDDRGHILFAFVSVCVIGRYPDTPNWSSMRPWHDTITQSGIKVWYLKSISVGRAHFNFVSLCKCMIFANQTNFVLWLCMIISLPSSGHPWNIL